MNKAEQALNEKSFFIFHQIKRMAFELKQNLNAFPLMCEGLVWWNRLTWMEENRRWFKDDLESPPGSCMPLHTDQVAFLPDSSNKRWLTESSVTWCDIADPELIIKQLVLGWNEKLDDSGLNRLWEPWPLNSDSSVHPWVSLHVGATFEELLSRWFAVTGREQTERQPDILMPAAEASAGMET